MQLLKIVLTQILTLTLATSAHPIQPGDVESQIVSIYNFTNVSDDFSKVSQNCNQIMQLADQIERPDLKLLGFHLICWSADYHREMDELRKYVHFGNQFMAEQAERLALLDTGAVMRAGMIHATGQYYYALGNYERSIEEFIKIMPVNGSPMTTDSGLVRAACSYIGQSYISLGNLDKSVQYFELAKRFNQEDEDYNYFNALHIMYLAQYYHSIGKTEEALMSLNKALPLLLEDKRLAYVRNAKKSIYQLYAGFYRQIAKYDSAIHFTRKAISLFTKNDPSYVECYRLLGDIFYKSNLPDSAQFYYKNSLSLSGNIYPEIHYTKAKPLNGIGNILRDEKKFIQAYKTYLTGLLNLSATGREFNSKYLRDLILPQEGMLILVDLGKLYFNWFQSAEQTEYLDSCINVLENALFLNDISRREQFSTESKESRALLQADITDLGINASVLAFEKSHNPGYLQKAYFFMEKNKGNILLDRIYETKARSFSGIPDSLLDGEFRLRKEVSLYKDRLLSVPPEDTNFAEITRKYQDKQMEYINLISGIEKNYNKYYMLKYESASITAEEVKQLIPSSGRMILQYYVGSDKIYIAAITRKKIIIKSTPRNENLDKNLIGLINQINNKEITEIENDSSIYLDFIRYSRYLYTHLLDPVLTGIQSGIKEITIIPDGFLSYLPFEILLTKDPDEKIPDYSLLPYLIKNYRITYDHSASLIFSTDKNHKKIKRKYLGFAPEYASMVNLSRLTSNRDEIEACRKIWRGNSYIGDQATEMNFRSSSSGYSIVHLAAHTVLNDENPQASCLVFTGSDAVGGEGMLYIHELYNLDLHAQLMILSACETGIGQIKRGEGIISLARAFRYAGCHNILMSLWKVNDKTTKEIMVLFNKNLRKGMPKDKALQHAKLKYLQGSHNLHPAFWASMILIGDQKPIAGGIGYKVILPAFILLIVVFLFRKKLFQIL